ncbi:MAG: hypothetical protein AB7K41_10220 [Bdellovibrionales bacterium]
MKKVLFVISLMLICSLACTSKEKRLAQKVEQASGRLQHLSAYKQIDCQIRVKLSEPTKTAWLNQLTKDQKSSMAKSLKSVQGKKKLFLTVESQVFNWRSTPYRCRLLSEQTTKLSTAQELLLRDTEKKLESVMCVWMQSFYADSPLRGWRQSRAVLEEVGEHGVRLDRGSDRALEILSGGEKVTAYLGVTGGQLTGFYQTLSDKLYPVQIEQQKGQTLNRLQELNYIEDLGRQVPASFWLSLQQEGLAPPSAYMYAQFHDCKSR